MRGSPLGWEPRSRGTRSEDFAHSANPMLSDVYGQLKGFSSRSLKLKWPDRVFWWADIVYSVTVNPNSCRRQRAYIRNQRTHHKEGTFQPHWEPEDSLQVFPASGILTASLVGAVLRSLLQPAGLPRAGETSRIPTRPSHLSETC